MTKGEYKKTFSRSRLTHYLCAT